MTVVSVGGQERKRGIADWHTYFASNRTPEKDSVGAIVCRNTVPPLHQNPLRETQMDSNICLKNTKIPPLRSE